MPSHSPSGRPYVLGIITTVVLISLVTILLTNLATGFERIGTQLIRFLLTLVLCVLLYQGRNWARWIMGVLFGLSGGAACLSGVFLLSQTPFALLLIVQGVAYLACVGILFFHPSMRTYFSHVDVV